MVRERATHGEGIMMSALLDNLEYGRSWHDFAVDYYEGYTPNMSDYHMHSYYEVSLILAGEVTVLFADRSQSGSGSRLVLTAPYTAHYIIPERGVFYSRKNLLFTAEFLSDVVPGWEGILRTFGRGGCVIPLEPEQADGLLEWLGRIEAEKDIFRQKLLILYTLSRISELPGKEAPEEVPAWLSDCLRYLSENYREKLTAQMLADRFSVGRTTLMTAFKRYTGMTVRDYLTRCRLRNSVRYLRQGMSEAEAAELCGFGDACGLIRAYRRYFRTTPRRYLAGDAALSRHPE